jgi:hypothetical protein
MANALDGPPEAWGVLTLALGAPAETLDALPGLAVLAAPAGTLGDAPDNSVGAGSAEAREESMF